MGVGLRMRYLAIMIDARLQNDITILMHGLDLVNLYYKPTRVLILDRTEVHSAVPSRGITESTWHSSRY